MEQKHIRVRENDNGKGRLVTLLVCPAPDSVLPAVAQAGADAVRGSAQPATRI